MGASNGDLFNMQQVTYLRCCEITPIGKEIKYGKRKTKA
jgi:hypothetical protein